MSEPIDGEPPKHRRIKKKRRRVDPAPAAKVRSTRPQRPTDLPALIVFALLIVAGPLAFGAVDQLFQVALLVVFAAGLALRPPALLSLPPLATRFVFGTIALLVLKEFAPAALFGGTSWRTILAVEHGIVFPWTHHPEPGRAVDVLLAGLVAVLWFLWVRNLADSRENRPVLAWSMFAAAVIVAGVSFATYGQSAEAIYGLRYTPGWRGFGPFPNRNHTACFLAMGTLIGFGCIAWAGTRRKWAVVAGAAVLTVFPLAALLTTQSRGGLVGLAAGCTVYVGLLLWRYRSKRVLMIVATAAFLILAIGLAFGGPVFARFSSPATDVSSLTRVQLWSDTLLMWRDAPLFGHGAGSFQSVFPLYLRTKLDEQPVLHPESSWLQWLVEFGAVPLLLVLACVVWFVAPHVRELLARRHGFSLPAAAFAAGLVLVVHCAIDVPGHRWGTAAFALAAFALALPPRRPADPEPVAPALAAPARVALLPLGIALLWSAPLWADWPRWSPLQLARFVDFANREITAVSVADLDAHLAAFPLNSKLHYLRGYRELQRLEPSDEVWQRHFRAAFRLFPSSWRLPINAAQACAGRAPDVAISYWQTAIERGGMRRHEIFANALTTTRRYPRADQVWSRYVEAHPELALLYARTAPPEKASGLFQRWWRARGSVRGVALEEAELRAFYAMAPQWLTPPEFEEWMRLHAERGMPDYQAWARILHAWQQDEQAWRLLARHTQDPPWPTVPATISREQMLQRWKRFPENMLNAQNLATAHFRAGDLPSAREVIFSTARRPDTKAWFVQKAAYLLAGEGKHGDAVELLLNAKPAPGR